MGAYDVSPARRGLDKLLELHPHFDVVSADAQVPTGDNEAWSPWLLVMLGQRSEGEREAYALYPFAIWKSTGAVHGIGNDGAVTDDPLWTP